MFGYLDEILTWTDTAEETAASRSIPNNPFISLIVRHGCGKEYWLLCFQALNISYLSELKSCGDKVECFKYLTFFRYIIFGK